MTSFITEDFLLRTEFAKRLYHGYANDLPLIDYHNHLSPQEIATNRKFANITQAWLEGDHYKWRAMRTLGVGEKFITGKASDEEKFGRWAYTVPYTMRNPLYHWTHLELKRYFDVDELLDADSAKQIYKQCNDKLSGSAFTTRGLLEKLKVEVVCTTDDPADSLEHHTKCAKDGFAVLVLPTFRPDKAYAVEHTEAYKKYIERLSSAAGINIDSFDKLIEALAKRIDFFHSHGCRLADHGLENLYYSDKTSTADGILKKVLKGNALCVEERSDFKSAVLLELGKLYHKKGWVQQFHIGALRNNNQRMMAKLGADSGFDSVGDFPQSVAMAKFFNALDITNQLAKTILYNLNPADNEVMASMTGNFNDGSVKGKIQYGSAWWFLDQKDGIEKQINTLSNLGLLSCFIGMLTDSRSFLSFPRHEYFRRVLCNLIGNDVEEGLLPGDEKLLGKMVSDVCYYNAKEYFGFVTSRGPSLSPPRER